MQNRANALNVHEGSASEKLEITKKEIIYFQIFFFCPHLHLVTQGKLKIKHKNQLPYHENVKK